MEDLLKEFAQIFKQNDSLGQLEYSHISINTSESPLPLSGQIQLFYQSLKFEEPCYFTGGSADMALVPLSQLEKMLEGWQSDWREGYIIFAYLMGDDIVFCDSNYSACPVYGRITGWTQTYALAPSLEKFLILYSQIKKLQIEQFEGQVYDDETDDLKNGYLDRVDEMIGIHLSEDYREDFKSFMID